MRLSHHKRISFIVVIRVTLTRFLKNTPGLPLGPCIHCRVTVREECRYWYGIIIDSLYKSLISFAIAS